LKTFLIQSLLSLGTGLLTGVLFAWIRLPIPAPPVIPAVFGIFGITLGYLLFQRFFGG
jgi:XapX domain-containing protein